jgi:hypothetical protein
MSFRVSLRALGLAGVCLVWSACGGRVVFDGVGGAGASGGAGGSGNTGNQGGSGNVGNQGGGGGVPFDCATVGPTLVTCLDAAGSCVPLFDDVCCPTCTPGACADCTDPQFYECVPASACEGGTSCGFVPSWFCEQEPAPCSSIQACSITPGCVLAECATSDPNCQPECHAVTAGTCTAFCEIEPPPCPDDLIAEADGACYTGFCVPLNLCAIPL